MGVVSCGTTMLDQGVFENIGSVTWDTTAKTSGFTAVSGTGYFCNTTSAAFTVTLPSSPSAGDIVGIKDYANTADTNNITIGRNGSNIQGTANDYVISTEGRSVFLVYVDATKGWLVTGSAKTNDISGPKFTAATGGTITTSGDFKIHTFTSPGTFTVTQLGNSPTIPTGGPSNVDYLVVAGGGGGGGGFGCGSFSGGGGGAGGFRTSFPSPAGVTPVAVQGYPITVGAGGPGASSPCGNDVATPGNNSVFSSITSAGGGGGRMGRTADSGGSGGGTTNYIVGGTAGLGNTPPVSPPQGNPGGLGTARCSGGGGGASVAGNPNKNGGNGTANSITGSSVTRAGGGSAGGWNYAAAGTAGTGGGGTGGSGGANGGNGTVNTGGGGGGAGPINVAGQPLRCGGTGGSGIVIIRYKFQ
jgi:hypothetical protein